MAQAFDRIAESYDQWYETTEGRAIFGAELECLRLICESFHGQWLEVGAGTGRFASNLGIARGIDPSMPMLKIATERGILACAGRAENIPFREHSFDGALLALTLCFLEDSCQAMRECRRILRPLGSLLLGMIPADSPWGKLYKRKRSEGHPVYAAARFFDPGDIAETIHRAGFKSVNAASTLFWGPESPPDRMPRVEFGIRPDAGFVALHFVNMES